MILNDNDLIFAKVRPNAIIPTKNDENAGFDIYACFDEDFIVIPAHKTVLVPTGIASATTEKYYLQVQERGSTGSKGIKYSAGVIDSGYRGEIFIALSNVNDEAVIISKLNVSDLIKKHSEQDNFGNVILKYGDEKWNSVWVNNTLDGFDNASIYPYSKAIAQLLVYYVPPMNVKETSYEELLQIPSKRGTGALGSSGK